MLRECHRVLEPGGLLAGYLIHTPSGLSPDQERKASELGPSQVTAVAPPEQLARSAGLTVMAHKDVTPRFKTTCDALIKAWSELEDALRAEEGDELYEEEREKKYRMLEGIEEGLLLRCLLVAVRS